MRCVVHRLCPSGRRRILGDATARTLTAKQAFALFCHAPDRSWRATAAFMASSCGRPDEIGKHPKERIAT
jgi:hypothetical protein